MAELIVSDYARHQQTVTVADAQSTNYSSSANGSMNHWYVISELTFKAGIEVLRATKGGQAV
jgi:hypothetical protein